MLINNTITNTNIVKKVGIFLDIENFIGSLYQNDLPFNINTLTEFGKSYGDIICKKSYGDIIKSTESCEDYLSANDIRTSLAFSSFDIEDIPYMSNTKNSADISLALGCYKIALTTVLDVAILVTKDSDFIPLYKLLRELNIQVIVVNPCLRPLNTRINEHVSSVISYKDLISSYKEENLSLKEKLDSLLKINIPNKKHIIEIFSKSIEQHTHMINLKTLVAKVVSNTSYSQDIIYRLLLSLIYAKSIEVKSYTNYTNPNIVSFNNKTPKELYKDFLMQCSFLIKKNYNIFLENDIFENKE